jgi:hypothetical protein
MSDAEKKLQEAKYFLKRMLETHKVPFEFECNLQAFISSARSVTFVLKTEYSEKTDFQKWYQEKQEEMKADEMLRFFNKARTTTIHRKPLNVATISHIRNIYLNSIPEGWGFAITNKGEPVWITPSGDEVHAFEFDDQVERVYLFDDPPKSFLGSNLRDFSVVTLCRLYLSYLSQLVKVASEKFEGLKS